MRLILSVLFSIFFLNPTHGVEILDLAKTVTQGAEKELTLSQDEAVIVIKTLEDPKARALLITQLKALGKVHQETSETTTEKIQGFVKNTGYILEEITAFPLKAAPRALDLYDEYKRSFLLTISSQHKNSLFSLGLNLLFMGLWFLIAPIQRFIRKNTPTKMNSWQEIVFAGFVTLVSFVIIIASFTLIQTLIAYMNWGPLYAQGKLSLYLLIWQAIYVLFFMTLNIKKDASIGKFLSLSWYAFVFFSVYLFSLTIGLSPKFLYSVETLLKTIFFVIFLRSMVTEIKSSSEIFTRIGKNAYFIGFCFVISIVQVMSYLTSPLSDSLELSLRMLSLYGFWHGFVFLVKTMPKALHKLELKHLNNILFLKPLIDKRYTILSFLMGMISIALSFPTIEKLTGFWLHPQLIKWLTVCMIIWLMYGLTNFLTDFIKDKISKDQEDDRTKAVMASLWPVFEISIKIVTLVVGMLLCLAVLNYPIMPLLVSLSFVGFAIGFGAQNAVKDLFGGIAIILEKNLAIGDYVNISENSGKVEKITLRTVYLRLSSGALQTIPFSEVKSIVNKSRENTYCCVEACIGYGSDLEKAQELMLETYDEMKHDPLYKDRLIGDFSFYGLDKQKEFALTLSGRFESYMDPTQDLSRVFMLKLHKKLAKFNLFPKYNFHAS